MVANTAFQASPSRPTPSLPRDGASAAWSPGGRLFRHLHEHPHATRRVVDEVQGHEAHEGHEEKEAELDGPEPVRVAARDRIDVLLDVVHLRHVALRRWR